MNKVTLLYQYIDYYMNLHVFITQTFSSPTWCPPAPPTVSFIQHACLGFEWFLVLINPMFTNWSFWLRFSRLLYNCSTFERVLAENKYLITWLFLWEPSHRRVSANSIRWQVVKRAVHIICEPLNSPTAKPQSSTLGWKVTLILLKSKTTGRNN